MKSLRFVLIGVLFTTSAYGQLATRNPLDELRDQVGQVLTEAGVAFTPEQEKELALLIEEQRQASEDLFGQIMDFRGGIPQGQQMDRALAGIQWIHDEFKKRLPDYLTDEQKAAWEKFESAGSALGVRIETAGDGRVRTEEIQQIRINNNPFTTEDGGESNFGNITGVSFGGNFGQGGGGGNGQGGGGGGGNWQGGGGGNSQAGGGGGGGNSQGGGGNWQGGGNFQSGNRTAGERTEIIQRGGTGAYHGNFTANFQDEKLNARNPFANNKPPYHERTINGNFGGPLIRNRLSLYGTVNDNRQENVGTVKAETLEGPFSLGVTRPQVSRNYQSRAILQFSDTQSVHVGGRYATGGRKNRDVGDFTLPSRGSNYEGMQNNVDVRQISVLSARSVHETRLTLQRNHNKTTPITEGVAINVLDAFRGGGGQERNDQSGQTFQFGNLLYLTGEKLTLRAGIDGRYRRQRNRTEANFTGEFTFSNLEDYRNGAPLKYRITKGDPLLEFSQFEVAFFAQNDLKVTNRFTFSYGARYEVQTNLSDKNNIDPRLALAYAVGGATVIRAGVGVFHHRLQDGVIQNLLRLDGTRQYEILVDSPGWPDPYASGSVKIPAFSRRVRDPELVAPYNVASSISLERTLPGNLFVTMSSDFNQGRRLLRSRNLNAPLPGTGMKPFPDEGHIYQLESTGKSTYKNLRLAMRQRFSIFNVTATYTLASGFSDADQPFNLPANNYDLAAEWGPSESVARHSFNTSVNSRLPQDVYLTTIITANSGTPYNVTTGKDDNLDGQTNDRPIGVPRNSAHGPRFFNVSFNFSKAFWLRGASGAGGANGRGGGSAGGSQLSVFLNAYNALNMTNPGTPSGVMTSPFFGKSFNGSAPREIEAGMRFQF